ncbi:response regulator transcription factor [Pararoseomonas sp. SCSIO 73927]|uniref:response regulator transcription factor n=1 Tax=Pararoseomonas sp. SCSIO 73927 TaxID=3114537 RepID=UPI0030CFCE75
MIDPSIATPPVNRALPLEWPCRLGRVLVVDDDREARDAVLAELADHQCHAVGSSGRDVQHHLQRSQFSLVILDVRAGRIDGFGVLRRIRAHSDVPVILTTRQQQDEVDRILGLELGADEFSRDPLNPRELLARAHAILRRQEVGRRQSAAVTARGGYRFNGWELRRCTRVLTNPAGEVVELTKTEYALLVAFLEAPRRPLSRAHLIRTTKAHEDVQDRSIDVQVLRLRRKIEADRSGSRLIRTERGIGYILDVPVEILF